MITILSRTAAQSIKKRRVDVRAELEPGRTIGRDISRGEAVEHELVTFIVTFISKRHEAGGRGVA